MFFHFDEINSRLPCTLEFLNVPEYKELRMFYINMDSGEVEDLSFDFQDKLNPIDQIKLDLRINEWNNWKNRVKRELSIAAWGT